MIICVSKDKDTDAGVADLEKDLAGIALNKVWKLTYSVLNIRSDLK